MSRRRIYHSHYHDHRPIQAPEPEKSGSGLGWLLLGGLLLGGLVAAASSSSASNPPETLPEEKPEG